MLFNYIINWIKFFIETQFTQSEDVNIEFVTLVTTFQITLQKVADHFPVLQVSRAALTLISVPVDVRTQAMYQMMDQGFVGLIFSCFIEDKNTKVGNLKMATNPLGAHGKHEGRAEALGTACREGRAVLGAHGKNNGSGLDCDAKGRSASDSCSVLSHSLAALGGLQQLQSVL